MDIPSLSPEDQLILSCARIDISEDIKIKIEKILATDLNWEYILDTAIRHNIIVLLFYHLKEPSSNPYVPAEMGKKLKSIYYASLKRNIYLFDELERVLKALNGCGVQVVPLKGAFLAETIYNNIALRPMDDLDLLIKNQDYYIVKNKLVSMGYKGQIFRTSFHEYIFQKVPLHEEATFYRSNYFIDIHWGIESVRSDDIVNIGHFCKNVHLIKLADSEAYAFSPENLIIYLCIHAYKHLFLESAPDFKFIFYCDIAEVIRFYDGKIDWEKLLATVKAYGVTDALYCCLNSAYIYLDAPVPSSLLDDLRKNAPKIDQAFFINPLQTKNRETRRIRRYDLTSILLTDKVDLLSKIRILFGYLFPHKEYVLASGNCNDIHPVATGYLNYYKDMLTDITKIFFARVKYLSRAK